MFYYRLLFAMPDYAMLIRHYFFLLSHFLRRRAAFDALRL